MYLNIRGSLGNSKYKFEHAKKATVGFLGGSITEMKGWKEMVEEDLQQRFPDTEFEFIHAGIASTGSTPHSFRLEKDLLDGHHIDLLFVEAAVNDATNEPDIRKQLRGMEGVIRHIRTISPETDIVMLHFVFQPLLDAMDRGETPLVILQHEKVAAYYNIPSINLAREVHARINAGEFDWKTFGGTHPAPFGHNIYARAISKLFDKMWAADSVSGPVAVIPHTLPQSPVDLYSYYNGRLIDPEQAKMISGCKIEEPWKSKVNGTVRNRYARIKVLEALSPGAELEFEFTGRAIGIYSVPGPDAGIVEYSIDDSAFKKYNLFTDWSKTLHIPWVHIFEDELEDGTHILRLRMTTERDARSIGTACQIYYFTVN
jgi:lysophospholipase L1-like esterase